MGDADEPIEGDGWVRVSKPSIAELRASDNVDHLLPDAPWFWQPLERFCVAGCCGLEAFDFSPKFVRWVTHRSTDMPGRDSWRHDEVGDIAALATELRKSASTLEKMTERTVNVPYLNEILAPAELAGLLNELAEIIEIDS